MFRRFGVLLLVSGCMAAGEAPVVPAGPSPSPSPSPGPSATTSYYRDVQPLIERSCIGCHTTGGAAPLSFDDPAAVARLAPAINGALASGRMPPFYASKSCNTYANDPRLTTEELALVATWTAEGGPLGDAADARHASPITVSAIRHDKMMDIGGEFDTRLMSKTDNYRCFIMDPGAAGDLMVSGYEVIPGNKQLVHHVLAYLVAPANIPDVEALDAAEPGLGYECFGGVGVPGALGNQIAGWVPGGSATSLPEGTGIPVAAGSRVVVQIHYNLLALGAESSPMDQTRVALQTAPAGSLEAARIIPMLKHDLAIDAYDADSFQVGELPLPRNQVGTTVYRLTGHMHMLGKQVKLEVVHGDGSSTCLLDIPRWDFQWQREYSLVTPYTVAAGDRLKITCVYDNSAAHQPVVNGTQQTPRDVAWGESSLDEMCMTYMTFTAATR